MTSNVKFDQEKHDHNNIIPLGNDEIKSILKTQSEAVFEDKNITNNSNFVKKSLIDIAMDFETKESKKEKSENTENIKENIPEPEKNEHIKEKSNEDVDQKDSTDQNTTSNEIDEPDRLSDQSLSEPELVDQNNDGLNTTSDETSTENNQSDNMTDSNTEIGNVNNQIKDQIDESEIISASDNKIDETQQALESVRNAVSQSINNSDTSNENISNESEDISIEVSENISKDFDQFKNIFSSLSNLGEKAIFEALQIKIIDIAYELAGYQIDKMPEKYEKKIKALLKNINCFEDKMKIEVNDQDYDALSKIDSFFDTQDKSIFVSNKDLSRGDIILNCDGMHYSEKSNKT